VERRHEPRAESNSRVEITILGEHCIGFPARLLNQSGQGLSLSTDQPIPLNAPVRIDLEDSILLGEVCYCSMEDGRYITGIKLQHLLHGLTDLNRLVAGIMGESWPRRPSQPSRQPALITSQKAG
jgi:hypothetical protein